MSSTAFPPLSPPEPPRVFGAPVLHTEADLLALGIAADGTLWSVEEPGLLRQWSLATRRQVSERALDEAATVWAFNWAARLLASGSSEVDVWEISSGDRLVGWSVGSWVTALAFQPGAPLLAAGHDDGKVHVWHWVDRKLLRTIAAHKMPVSAVAFSLDMTRLATAGEDRLIRIWDLATGERVLTIEGHTDRIPALAWHPDDKRLFSAGWDTTVRVWDAESGQPIILLNSHATQVHALALSADGRLLASADSDQAVHLWDADHYITRQIIREQTGEVRHLCFTPDDGKGNATPPLLAYGGSDRVIHLWHSRHGPEQASVDPLLLRTRVAVSPDGKQLFSLGGGTDLRGWDVESGQPTLALEGTPVLRAFAMSPDGRHFAASRQAPADSPDLTTLALYDANGNRVAVCDGQRGPITALAFRSDGAQLASGGVQSSDVWLWSAPAGQPVLLIPDAVDDCSVEALAFQPGGPLLAVAGIDYMATSGHDGEVALWHADEKREVGALDGGATAIAWHPDGKRLAAATLRRVVRVWDTQTSRVAVEMQGHTDTITSVAWSADGRWLASAGEDRTVRLWDGNTGDLAGAWELDNPVRALAFSPDGRWLFTGNGNTSCYQIEVVQLLASGM
jgi:WD40 repeat protein